MSQPQISPDGRFYWDGERWVPMPTQAAPQVTLKQGNAFSTGFFSSLGGSAAGCVGCLAVPIIILLLIGFTAAAIGGASHSVNNSGGFTGQTTSP